MHPLLIGVKVQNLVFKGNISQAFQTDKIIVRGFLFGLLLLQLVYTGTHGTVYDDMELKKSNKNGLLLL